MENSMPQIRLREVEKGDLDIFFRFQKDPEAVRMAAFIQRDPDDREAFNAHWDRLMSSRRLTIRTILYDGEVAGSIARFEVDGDNEVTYWIGRDFWGKGIATEALKQFLQIEKIRPLIAKAAKDNIRSIRVLAKNGFVHTGEEIAYARARGEEIPEAVFILKDR